MDSTIRVLTMCTSTVILSSCLLKNTPRSSHVHLHLHHVSQTSPLLPPCDFPTTRIVFHWMRTEALKRWRVFRSPHWSVSHQKFNWHSNRPISVRGGGPRVSGPRPLCSGWSRTMSSQTRFLHILFLISPFNLFVLRWILYHKWCVI